MKKCLVCVIGSWVVGLAAIAWGVLAAFGSAIEVGGLVRVVAAVVGIYGIGFLWYQPPLKPCPRCVAVNRGS